MRSYIRDHSKIYITIAAAGLAVLSCSLVSGLIPNRGEEASRQEASERPVALTPAQPRTPGAETPVAPAWPEDEPLPADLEDVYQFGVARGLFGPGEGLLLLLKPFLGISDPAPIPGLDQLPMVEANWLLAASSAYIAEHPDDPVAAELELLLQQILPPEQNLRQYVDFEPLSGRPAGSAARVPAPQRQQNCRGLWREGFPSRGDSGEDFYCFRAIVSQVNGATLEVFLPLEWLEDNQRSLSAEAIADAMVKSHQVYSQYGQMGDATVIIVPWTHSRAAAVVSPYHARGWESCPIIAYSDADSMGTDLLQWFIAHEMFHCFQLENYTFERPLSSRPSWWVEGSAVYFSNVVYPDFQGKHRFLTRFDHHSNFDSIVEMSYQNYVLFHYLANLHDNDWLVDMMAHLPRNAPLVEHQRALADPMPQDEFHAFGQAYLDQNIPDTGGGSIPISTRYISTIKITEEINIPMLARPFVLRRHRLNYEFGNHFVQVPQSPDEGRISVRPDATMGWETVPSDVRSFCSDPAHSLLLTTTEAGKPYEVEFEIPLVDDEAWEMTLSDGTVVSGDHGLYVAGTGPIIVLSQSDSEQSEPLINLTSGGVYIFETADGTEYAGHGERVFDELPSGSLQGEFSARFWADPTGILRGDPPDFTGRGTFEACPQQ